MVTETDETTSLVGTLETTILEDSSPELTDFLSLPRELREQIYSAIFQQRNVGFCYMRGKDSSPSMLIWTAETREQRRDRFLHGIVGGILVVNKSIRAEALPKFWRHVTVHLPLSMYHEWNIPQPRDAPRYIAQNLTRAKMLRVFVRSKPHGVKSAAAPPLNREGYILTRENQHSDLVFSFDRFIRLELLSLTISINHWRTLWETLHIDEDDDATKAEWFQNYGMSNLLEEYSLDGKVESFHVLRCGSRMATIAVGRRDEEVEQEDWEVTMNIKPHQS